MMDVQRRLIDRHCNLDLISSGNTEMFIDYLKTAFRNLRRHLAFNLSFDIFD